VLDGKGIVDSEKAADDNGSGITVAPHPFGVDVARRFA
jgi:hypothetical protein